MVLVAEEVRTVFDKLLVPLDGTAESAAVLPLARTVARVTGGQIVLARVVAPEAQGTRGARASEARAYLARIADELRADNTRVATVVCQSDAPATEILRQAASTSADLLVMATHGRSGLRRALLGSVTEGVLAHSSLPVLLARPGGHRPTRIDTLLVPVDGSPGASLALGTAVPFARAANARLVLLQVVVPSAAYLVSDVTGAASLSLDPAWDEEALAGAERYVTGLAARLQRAGLSAEGRAVMGNISETLMGRVSSLIVDGANAVAADLIVMSTHGFTGPVRAVLGSTADEVVRTAHRPVLLVRQR